jgi:ADP-dependent NAD(P)H-hydrate dehydratase / NAD(P)H-hydrate epimerase
MADSGPQRIVPGDAAWPLHDVRASRAIEAAALAVHPPQALMQRAGLAVARWALALAPHARRVWVACGPGNNGGDGLVAALHLHRAGLAVTATLHGDRTRLPADAAQALADARQGGVPVSAQPVHAACDLAIDALLGLGASRAPQGEIAAAIDALNALQAPVLAVDLPSGLSADTGCRLGAAAVRAAHTLSLLTLKPGLFTAQGRDHAGQIWLDALHVDGGSTTPSAHLIGSDALRVLKPRLHASHKGRFGDLAVVGGAAGMTGAALLAARAALASGAGRVFVSLLESAGPAVDVLHPELMFRPGWWQGDAQAIASCTVVCGCGGGDAVRQALPVLLARCPRLVLDADALNAIAADETLQRQLSARAHRHMPTAMTPHPLEAARLLGSDAAAVQADRLQAARTLAQRHGCVVLLKGSGSVVAMPDGRIAINPSGNGLLAGGGTGDVLAGWIGGLWAQLAGTADAWDAAHDAVLAAVWLHGDAADRLLQQHPRSLALPAGELIEHMRRAAAQR